MCSDNWDHFVSLRIFGRLTVHNFPAPPSRVLDLGCGTGLWVIDAAKQWKVCLYSPPPPALLDINANQNQHSTFVGFDIKKIQPSVISSPHIGCANPCVLCLAIYFGVEWSI
jgi:hypothetical protein